MRRVDGAFRNPFRERVRKVAPVKRRRDRDHARDVGVRFKEEPFFDMTTRFVVEIEGIDRLVRDEIPDPISALLNLHPRHKAPHAVPDKDDILERGGFSVGIDEFFEGVEFATQGRRRRPERLPRRVEEEPELKPGLEPSVAAHGVVHLHPRDG